MDRSIAFPTEPSGRLRALAHGWWRIAAVAAASVVLAVGAVAFTRSDVFRVRSIEVAGTAHLARADVIRIAGVSKRDNAVWLDERDAEERLRSDPWVAQAHVEIDLPWTVTITITERSPIAVVERGGISTLVAGDGTLLGPAPRGLGLPTIHAPPSWIASWHPIDVAGAARALAALDEDLRNDVQRASVGGADGIELYLKDGVRISIGGPGSATAKGHAIEDVLAWARETGMSVRSIDVTAPSAPAIVPAA